MWNSNQQQPQYASQISTRLDFPNQIQQRLPPRQSSPSSTQYSQSTNNNNTYSSNSTVTTNNSTITCFIFVFQNKLFVLI
jgi:hypothetical protein